MEEKETCNVHDCDIYHAIDAIKSRYAAVLLFSMDNEAKTFGELQREFDFITPTQLTRTLKQLCTDGLLEKDEKYRLTIAGKPLVVILRELESWYGNNF